MSKFAKKSTAVDSVIDDATSYDADIVPKIPIADALFVSTGSTLLDLAISGGRQRYGGVPSGRLVEIFGPSGAGKTALLAAICGEAQKAGGAACVRDPESRLDLEYAKIYDMSLAEAVFDYARPNTVTELFEDLFTWNPENRKTVNVFGGDSVAALSTNMEMESEDKMGGRRAKEFSQGFRKTARLIAESHKLVVFTNQVRQDMKTGRWVTPGGEALRYYSTIRIDVRLVKKIEKKAKTNSGVEVKKIIGIESVVNVVKNSADEPYRSAPLYIVFNYGLDDIRANLQYIKDMTKNTVYWAVTKEYQQLDKAIEWIEQNNLEQELKEATVDLWNEINDLFRVTRKKKG